MSVALAHERVDLPASVPVAQVWPSIADAIRRFSERCSVPVRDVLVLLPFAQHLPLARAAWASGEATTAGASWMPRFETTQTLGRAGVPRPAPVTGALTFDVVVDRLQAAKLLRGATGDWAAREPRSFATAIRRVVDTAWLLARRRLALPPDQRAAWMAGARALLGQPGGPAARERSLALLALEWAATATSAAAEALHQAMPGAWVVLDAGDLDPAVDQAMAAARVPVLRVVAAASFTQAAGVRLRWAACSDFEDEAQRTAADVLAHLACGEQPVGLIALDRLLLRRVRALLERQQVPLSDETGWTLSTTRAAATVVGLLAAVPLQAPTDAFVDWWSSAPVDRRGLPALEAAWRRRRVPTVPADLPPQLPADTQALWARWQQACTPLRAGRLPLAEWLLRLQHGLRCTGAWDALLADAAGAQVLQALRCGDVPHGSAWAAQAGGAVLDAAGFGQWVDDVLEAITFQPPLPAGEPAVVITPLARAVLRPFAAVVCPGADATHLGATDPPEPLLGNALAAALGLPTPASRRDAERAAFAQLLRAPRLGLRWRLRDGGEPLQPSALVLQLQAAAERSGTSPVPASDPRTVRPVPPTPVPRPLPSAPTLLPASVHATAYEELRACPYRFFAQRMLGLAEADELDDTIDKRDVGTWLHAVLRAFHAGRDPDDLFTAADDPQRLADAARHALSAFDADASGAVPDFLPHAAWFEQLAPRYLAWLHAEEARGVRVQASELGLRVAPAALQAVELGLHGQLDRIDAVPADAGRALRIVDYKTSSTERLRQRLRDPSEDTQLPFYAALLAVSGQAPDGPIEAAYLALDGGDAPVLLPHRDVAASAERLLAGMAGDFARLRAGAALPALGDGPACAHCRARGLCRRDHWPAEPPATAPGP